MLFRREFLFAGIIGLFALTAVQGQTRNWKLYDGNRYGFTVMFPQSPKVSTEITDNIPVTTFETENQIERYYVIATTTAAFGRTPKQTLDAVVDGHRRDMAADGWKVADNTNLGHDNILGRELIFVSGEQMEINRTFVTPRGIFVISAMVLRGNVAKDPKYLDEISGFLDSLRFFGV